MFRSIRWTLQLWHAGILVLALAGFATAMYITAYRTTYAEVDTELEGAARVLAGPPVLGAVPDPAIPLKQAFFNFIRNMPRDCLGQLGSNELAQPYFVVWGADGSVMRDSSPSPDVPYPGNAVIAAARGGAASGDATFRLRDGLREVIMEGSAGSTILVGRSMNREIASLANLRWSLLGAGATVLAIGLLGSWFLSVRVLRPIQTISDTARAISGSDLSRRIDMSRMQSELGSLAQTLNATFDRLEASFDRQVQFVADASHELRTPLSVIYTNNELALNRRRTVEEYRETIETTVRTSRRMKSLVESLLTLARADADALELESDRLDLWQLVEEGIGMLMPIAQTRNVSIQFAGEPVFVSADRGRILQLITNLLGNAIKYNRHGGSVRIVVAKEDAITGEDAVALLKVTDTGAGIALHDQPHVFERFFRADRARSRESGGCGLGLAICQSIAKAHGGSISFSSEPGNGTVFEVRLPLCDLEKSLPMESGSSETKSFPEGSDLCRSTITVQTS
jgi:two-component system, OmpR family, sensor kinase